MLWHRIHDSVSAAESENYKWRYDGNYRAPTWSWAAGVGPVDFMAISQEEEEVKDALAIAQIESIEYRLKGTDPHGDGASASIALKSLIVEGELVWADKQVPQVQVTEGATKTLVDIKLDFRTPEEGAKVYGLKVEKVFLFEIHRSTKNSYGLVLVQRGGPDNFERIGCFRREENWQNMTYGAYKETDGHENGRLVGGRLAIKGPVQDQSDIRLMSGSIFANAERKKVIIV
jgi:hypothetical protein